MPVLPSHPSPTWLLTGVPRSGSSLCCRLAGELPNTVALSEPLTRAEFQGVDSEQAACSRIERFVRQTRTRIASERKASSVQVAGALDDNMVAARLAEGGLRRRQASHGTIRIDKPLSNDFTLLIKHNALFAALLPRLRDRFSCFALVRNPMAVLASWAVVDLPVQRGRIPAGEQYDADLRERLERARRVLQRQLIILDWFFGQFANSLPTEQIIRYEDVIGSGGASLYRLLGHSETQPVALTSRNANALYRDVRVETRLAALLSADGAWRLFYTDEECRQVANALRRKTVP